MNNLRELRTKSGITQAELSRRVGVSQSAISLLEVDDVNPGRSLLTRICEALGVPEEEFRIDDDIVPDVSSERKKRRDELQRRREQEKRKQKAMLDTREHCIYKHTFPDGKVYIGQTISGQEEERWHDGVGYYGQKTVFRAIVKFGWDNIKHEILMDGMTAEEADEAEHKLIREYDSITSGYNTSR